MPFEVWTVQLTGADQRAVVKLAKRRKQLGLAAEYTETIRAAIRLAQSADDDTLTMGTLNP